MVEAAAEADEEFMEKYLETGELSVEEIKQGLRKRTISNANCPYVLWIRPLKIKACKLCWMPLLNICQRLLMFQPIQR